MSNHFFFDGSEDSGSDFDPNDSNLPFPKPLDRSAFLTADFDASTFLSNLTTRFQTLEDLQSELQELSQGLDKELVDLVNDNYQDFLSLGSTLAGGEERIEGVRVGLLGFQRDITLLREKIDVKRNEVVGLLQQKKALRKDIGVCRALLEIEERIQDLEEKLLISRVLQKSITQASIDADNEWGEEWRQETTYDSDDADEDDDGLTAASRLKRRIEQYRMLQILIRKLDQQHAYIAASQGRVRRIRESIESEAEEALKQSSPDIKQELRQIRASIDD